MEIVRYEDVKDELLSNLKRKSLLPVLASGFTRNSTAFNGFVPSGEEHRLYMIEQLANFGFTDHDLETLKITHKYSEVYDIYCRVEDKSVIKKYFKDHFTYVRLEENKRKFLSIPWPYIYTLNLDDAIEKNSDYDCVVCCNRHVEPGIFDSAKCVVKLHGDVWEEIKYTDGNGVICSTVQYSASVEDNKDLLQRLKQDGLYHNLIFIGCSLTDEFDLLSIFSRKNIHNVTRRYICVAEEPSMVTKLKYESYGITHCIVFDSFDAIYDELYLLGVESEKISTDELEQYNHFTFKKCSDRYDENKAYLLYGKSLLDKTREICYPYFFISRDHTERIINNMDEYSLQFVVGRRCAGKTYMLFDIVQRIRDKDTYIFETKDRLTDKAFHRLLEKKNSVLLFDSSSLSETQIEYLIKNLYDIIKRNIKIVVVINKSDRQILGIISLHAQKGVIAESDILITEVSNKFSQAELDQINPLLTSTTMGIFMERQTLLDNILRISETLNERSRYNSITPKTDGKKRLASLIALATERKLYSNRAVTLDIYLELEDQRRICDPLIDLETTEAFERSVSDHSAFKYVLNAEFWLCRYLSSFAINKDNCAKIVEAYQYLLKEIIENNQGPNLHSVNKNGTYKDYILFDNINRIFNMGRYGGRDGLNIVRFIYEGLNSMLSVDPNYMHQRAKCYIRLSSYERDPVEKISNLNKAFKDVNVSIQIFDERYRESENEHILISLDHLKYTKALILCHKCNVNDYNDVAENSEAILMLYEALNSPFNSYDYAKKDIYNYYDVISKIIHAAIANRDLVNEEAGRCLEPLFRACRGEA